MTGKPENKSAAKGAKKSAVLARNNQGRRFARERALQALYQWDLNEDSMSAVHDQFLERQQMDKVDVEYFTKVFKGISGNVDVVDNALSEAIDRTLEELDPIERNVLRVAVFEMQSCLEIPVRVVINEAVEITKRFGADQGHKYVNGVLDKLAARLRQLEISNRSQE